MVPSLLSSVSAVVLATALCVVGSPYISPKDLQWIWDNRMKSDMTGHDNWIIDHIVKNKGSLNYCVRWDSQTIKLTKETAQKIEAMLARQYAAWNRWLIGYNCWPYDEININIVDWAARKASDLEWSDNSLGKIYIGDLDQDGDHQCPRTATGRRTSSGCEGKPFDVSLWPTEEMTGGLGNYNFQQFGIETLLDGIDNEQLTVAAHEIGHRFGLPDFYEMPQPPNFKPCLMWGLSTDTMKDTDGWMVRRVLENKKPNYHF
ncbi:neutral zinc metallopeptidase [Phytophthora sojae]|uniref:Neutral zinc metallopeptidase n=1 Tax=Phytophthora sojae (strain P6497) TaxID=1094619 RepID=G4ZK75_PHYSP|nr:neutral zinc metallopeptidase [Phytophthora sojae]EGZ14879.1 neutral zinc metallopeptidase [Phytophthora sojae]|eukprot:XP_009528628.1 neutral zinc metallopeptidase [Phytophthora sojae]